MDTFSATWWEESIFSGPQWNCLPGGQKVGGDGDSEYGKPESTEEHKFMWDQMDWIAYYNRWVSVDDLQPNLGRTD